MLGSLQSIECNEAMLEDVKAMLEDEELGLQTANRWTAFTTEQTIVHLMQLTSLTEPIYGALIEEIKTMAQSPAVNEISAKDLSIWQTEEFVVWKPRDDSGFDDEPNLASQKAKEQAKAKAKAKAVSRAAKNDDQWAAQLKAELNKDKLAKDVADKAIAARNEALQQQAEVRAAVDAVAKGYREALLRLRCLVLGGKWALEPHLNEISTVVSGLLGNPLVTRLARERGLRTEGDA